MHQKPDATTPTDFPRDYGQGAVGGVQPKLLARKLGDVYVSGLTGEELYARYDSCVDLVNQLVDYCHRKLDEHPEWTAQELFERLRTTVEKRADWDLSAGEVSWVMARLCLQMHWPRFDDSRRHTKRSAK